MSEDKFTTAEEYIADSLDRAQKCLDEMFDPAKDKLDHTAVLSLICHFNTVVLLEALRRKDPAEADRITHWLDDIHEDGSTAGELIWQWRDQIKQGHQLTGVGPNVEGREPTPPIEATPCRIVSAENEWMDVLGIETETSGLLVTQSVRPRCEDRAATVRPGQWTITHERSGLRIPHLAWPLDVALKVAAELGTLGIDWTLDGDQLQGLPAREPRIAEILAATGDCRFHTDADHSPVPPWRATPSTEAELVTAGDGGES